MKTCTLKYLYGYTILRPRSNNDPTTHWLVRNSLKIFSPRLNKWIASYTKDIIKLNSKWRALLSLLKFSVLLTKMCGNCQIIIIIIIVISNQEIWWLVTSVSSSASPTCNISLNYSVLFPRALGQIVNLSDIYSRNQCSILDLSAITKLTWRNHTLPLIPYQVIKMTPFHWIMKNAS